MKYWSFTFLALLFLSCDYYGDYHYEVKNEMDLQVAVLTEQDTFLLDSGDQKRILTTGSGNLRKDEDPLDIFATELKDLVVLDVFVKDTLIEKDFRKRSFWDFQMNGIQSSTYLLRLSEDLVRGSSN